MIAISTGGILVAACLLAAVILPWWRTNRGGKGAAHHGDGGAPGKKGWRTLVAPFLCLSLGIICATSMGGAIGTGGRMATKGANQLGNDGLSVLAGAQAQTVSHPAPAPLSGGAALIVLVGLLIFGLAVHRAQKQRRRDLAFCLLAGLALGPAGFALQLAHGAILPALTSGGSLITGNM